MQTCVSAWQEVKFSFGAEVGHWAVAPLHAPWKAHSDSGLHFSSGPLKVHSAEQHGPWVGLWGKRQIYNQILQFQQHLFVLINSFINHRTVQRTAHHIWPADFARFEFALFALLFIGTVTAGVLTLVTVATVTLFSSFHQSITADRLTRLCTHGADTPALAQNLSSSHQQKKSLWKRNYQRSNCLASLSGLHLCCGCCRWRTCYCWACPQMWLWRTWCSCPALFYPEPLTLRGCIRSQSHAGQVKEKWERESWDRPTYNMLHGLAGSGQSHSTYRRAKVVPNLMSKGDVGDFGRDMGGIVLHSDDASVQRLLLSIRVQFVLLTDAPRASCDKTHYQTI